MIFSETEFAGAYLIDLEPIEDERGFFARTFCQHEFESRGLETGIAQTSISFSSVAGTLRGMHFQITPHQESKLVRCTRGTVYDVIVDLRENSETFRRWQGFELTNRNRQSLYVPHGFAHGFLTLEPDSEVLYQISTFYEPEAARGIRYNDPILSIQWPRVVEVISDKDRSWPDLE